LTPARGLLFMRVVSIDASFAAGARSRRTSEAVDLIAPRGNPLAHLVIIPGAGGCAAAFRPRVAPLLESGVAVSLYDPPGHGGRFLPFTFERARDEVAAHCRELPALPLFVLGHSMGAFIALLVAEQVPVKHVFAVAPLLDSRCCALALHGGGRIDELAAAFGAEGHRREALRAALASPDWLSHDRWPAIAAALAFPSRGALSVPDVGELLRTLFVPGYEAWDRLARVAGRASVFVAPVDSWFPRAELDARCLLAGVPPVEITTADGHAFGNGWREVMMKIVEHLQAGAST
jgi:pimeloyl-ACP methyl ester carboxylesterase